MVSVERKGNRRAGRDLADCVTWRDTFVISMTGGHAVYCNLPLTIIACINTSRTDIKFCNLGFSNGYHGPILRQSNAEFMGVSHQLSRPLSSIAMPDHLSPIACLSQACPARIVERSQKYNTLILDRRVR